jgi:hypothetical protein
MSAGSRPLPLGFVDDTPARHGLMATAGGWSPGPVTADKYPGRSPLGLWFAGAAAAALQDFRKIELTVGAVRYRLRRAGRLWNADAREEPVERDEARQVIEEAARLHGHDSSLLAIIREAATQLDGFRRDNAYVVVRLHQWESSGGTAVSSPSPAPAPSRSRPEAAPAPVAAEPVMSEALARAQAAVLSRAAADGVPFCEECARLAAAPQPAAPAQPA